MGQDKQRAATLEHPPPKKRRPRHLDDGRGPQDNSGRFEGSATLAPAQPRKWVRVLRAFVDGGTFNRFDAYRELRDSCLNTTVSQIEARGVVMLRVEETVHGAFGLVRCMRYRLAPESFSHARELLSANALAKPPDEPTTSETAL